MTIFITKCFFITPFYDIICTKDYGKRMKKFSICAVLTGIVSVLPLGAGAVYPVYQNQQMVQNYPAYQAYPVQIQTNMPNQVYLPSPNSVVVSNTVTNAASPNRITGALPKVGSNNTNAGRQYYMPSDYDRLADSGLYVGLAAAYTASLQGSMYADYQSEPKAGFVPGAFQAAKYNSDTVIPLQLSVGAAINNDIRADFSYLRYSGFGYPSNVQSSDGIGGYVNAQVEGGAITANATMLNLYYNVDSFTGYIAGGALRPYIGAGVGIALNTIADYVVYDNTFYSEMDPGAAGAGDLTGISDVYAYHNGGTSEQFAFMLEGGVSTDLEGGIKLDFFVRYSNLGKVRTSGSIIVSQTEWLGDGAGGEYQAPYDSVFHYTNWYESGKLSSVDVGVRLRLQF